VFVFNKKYTSLLMILSADNGFVDKMWAKTSCVAQEKARLSRLRLLTFGTSSEDMCIGV
jgi:hypothetical protein